MSVRKRTWTNGKGEHASWVVDYRDAKGIRRLKTFDKKKDADAFAATATVEIARGIHVADSASISITKAGDLWMASANATRLELATLKQYRQHLDLHIAPLIGDVLLAKLTGPVVRAFVDELRNTGRSEAMTRKVVASLSALVSDAYERGLTPHNAVRNMRRRSGSSRRLTQRLRIGIDIPTPEEIKRIIAALSPRWRPLLTTAIFTGLRASELRGLSWRDVDLGRREIHVTQRADRFNKLGPPKTANSKRTIPTPPSLVSILREWKIACPIGEYALVFPNGAGNIETLANIRRRGLIPAVEQAGVLGEKGNAKYTGLHCLRHFYASWCINAAKNGGLGLPAKITQERLGHATLAMTMDTYGHLFPRENEAEEMASAAEALMTNAT